MKNIRFANKYDDLPGNLTAFYTEPFPNVRSAAKFLKKINGQAELTFSIFPNVNKAPLIEITVGQKEKTIAESFFVINFMAAALTINDIPLLGEVLEGGYVSGHSHPFRIGLEEKHDKELEVGFNPLKEKLVKEFQDYLPKEKIKEIIENCKPSLSDSDLRNSCNRLMSKCFMIQYQSSSSIGMKNDRIRLSIYKDAIVIKQHTFSYNDPALEADLKELGLVQGTK